MSIFEKEKKVVTRMAPSPTGHLHIGTARATLFNYLYAQRNDGKFILRSEDTDKERSKKEYEEEILNGLASLGITWDEFYRQSERTEIYTGYLQKMIDKGKAYESEEESKNNPGEKVTVVRLKNPNKEITFTDEIRGEITFDTTELGDFVIARSIKDPLYHLTVVVDDHEMEVTHVIRGEDHISNTPRQILIQEAIGADRPVYAHLPLVLAPDKSKLSKRHGAVMLNEYFEQGFIKESLVNYLALLGWNPGTDQELFTMDELIQLFDLSGVQKGGAVFDIEKLKWFNKEHLQNYSNEEYIQYIFDAVAPVIEKLPQYDNGRFMRLLPIIRERVHSSSEAKTYAEEGEYDFAFKESHLDLEIIKWKNDATVKDALPRLQKLAEIVSTLPDDVTTDEIKDSIWHFAEETGKGEVLWPLRVALTGQKQSPDPFSVIYVIGPGEAYKRLRKACDTIISAS